MKWKTGRSGEGSDRNVLEGPAIEQLHILFDRHERHQVELARAKWDRTREAIEERGSRKNPSTDVYRRQAKGCIWWRDVIESSEVSILLGLQPGRVWTGCKPVCVRPWTGVDPVQWPPGSGQVGSIGSFNPGWLQHDPNPTQHVHVQAEGHLS